MFQPLKHIQELKSGMFQPLKHIQEEEPNRFLRMRGAPRHGLLKGWGITRIPNSSTPNFYYHRQPV